METVESIVVEEKSGKKWIHNFYFKNEKGSWVRQNGVPCSGRYKHDVVRMVSKTFREVSSRAPLRRINIPYEEQLKNFVEKWFSHLSDEEKKESVDYDLEVYQAIEVIECRTKQWVEKSGKMEYTKIRKF